MHSVEVVLKWRCGLSERLWLDIPLVPIMLSGGLNLVTPIRFNMRCLEKSTVLKRVRLEALFCTSREYQSSQGDSGHCTL